MSDRIRQDRSTAELDALRILARDVRSVLQDNRGGWLELQSCVDAIDTISGALVECDGALEEAEVFIDRSACERPHSVCDRCGVDIEQDEAGSWVDDTDGDGCDGFVHVPFKEDEP